ncbi:MAG TPA: hypothetical protein VGG28_15400 [Kofleriaceae bacterium]|jgi:hypothetical protein
MRIVIGLVALTSIAAANPRYTRAQVAPPPVAAVAARTSPPPPPANKPAIAADKAMHVEELADPIHRDQAALLEGLVRDTPDDDPQKADIIFRLAELYAMQARLWRLEAFKR